MHKPVAVTVFEVWYNQNTFIFWTIVGYMMISALLVIRFIRRPLIRWYHSQDWIIVGDSVIDILFKQIGYRLSIELFAFLTACVVGSIGGNLIALFWPRRSRRMETA